MQRTSYTFDRLREEMVATQLEERGISDPAVLDAMGKVPRHLFVSEALRDQAYGDFPLPIGEGQTISQPYIVAEMTQALELSPDDRVLELGTGSGYQAAVLAEIAFRGILNVAGTQVTSRADFGIKLLDWWGISSRETLSIGPTKAEWPGDTRLDLTLAQEILDTPLLGFDAVLNAHR